MAEEAAWLKIAADLREPITAGAEGHRPGDRLPTEDELMQRYGVSRGTVRQATSRLKQEGLIATASSRGTYVRRTPPVRRLSTDRFARAKREQGASRGAFNTELREMGYQGRTEWLELGRADCPADAAELLGITAGDPVMVRARLMFAAPVEPGGKVDYDAEEIMQLAASYIPWDIAEAAGVTGEDTGVGGLYSRIEDAGHQLDHFVEEAAVRMGTADECDRLKLESGALVLTLDRQAFDSAGRIVEICRHVMPPTYYRIRYEFPAS